MIPTWNVISENDVKKMFVHPLIMIDTIFCDVNDLFVSFSE